MTDLDRSRRVHALLQEALELDADRRAGFLSERCADDADLRQAVEKLLRNADQAEEFFDQLGNDVSGAFGAVAEPDDAHHTTAQPGAPARATLEIGETVGHFRVDGELGRGGMGMVYRATDLRLGREVALKVVPATVADSEQAMRFDQEARLLAALSHTNVASVFGIEESEGRRILVLELIDGPGLDDRIAQGRMRIAECLETAMQIARALEVAHRAGIVHRDLKPSNVKLVGRTGLAKVLDFGIATLLPDAPLSGSDAHRDVVSTGVGKVMGTVAYMSPEQARGDEVDERTDIWAWGCVLYEMLCGERPFVGRTVTDTLAAILEREPDWDRLPDNTPHEVQQMLRRCLRKDPRRRLRNAGDLWLVIEELLHPSTEENLDVSARRAATIAPTWKRIVPWAAAALALVFGTWFGTSLRAPDVPDPVRRLELLVDGEQLRTAAGGRVLAVSNDGSIIAHTADGGLHVRPLDAFADRELAGGLGAESPVFSPSGEWIAFFSRGSLRKLAVGGGEPFALCPGQLPRGADWGNDDRIIFSNGRALFTVHANGGTCEQVLSPQTEDTAIRYTWPSWLPGEGRVLFQRHVARGSEIAVADLGSGEITVLQPSGSDPRYLSDRKVLLFTRLGTVFSVPYDAETGEVGGTPLPLLDGVSAESTGASHMAVSDTGVLVYSPWPDSSRTLVWVDRDGTETPAADAAGDYEAPRVSPDARQIAVVVRRAGERQVWLFDLESQTSRQLTQGTTHIWPSWSPDGGRVTFSSSAEGPSTIWWQDVHGGAARRISTEGIHQYSSNWAANANVLSWFQPGPNGSRDIWVQRLDSEAGSVPVVTSGAHEQGPALSPDARWIAYAGNPSGSNEIYLEACNACSEEGAPPGPAGRWQVSTNGGGEPLWNPQGQELLYREGSKVMSVQIDFSAGAPRLAAPVEIFDGPYVIGQSGNRNFDVAPDGSRFLMVRNPEESGAHRIRVVLNWTDGL